MAINVMRLSAKQILLKTYARQPWLYLLVIAFTGAGAAEGTALN